MDKRVFNRINDKLCTDKKTKKVFAFLLRAKQEYNMQMRENVVSERTT